MDPHSIIYTFFNLYNSRFLESQRQMEAACDGTHRSIARSRSCTSFSGSKSNYQGTAPSTISKDYSLTTLWDQRQDFRTDEDRLKKPLHSKPSISRCSCGLGRQHIVVGQLPRDEWQVGLKWLEAIAVFVPLVKFLQNYESIDRGEEEAAKIDKLTVEAEHMANTEKKKAAYKRWKMPLRVARFISKLKQKLKFKRKSVDIVIQFVRALSFTNRIQVACVKFRR
jgi:hypothetical protein